MGPYHKLSVLETWEFDSLYRTFCQTDCGCLPVPFLPIFDHDLQANALLSNYFVSLFYYWNVKSVVATQRLMILTGFLWLKARFLNFFRCLSSFLLCFLLCFGCERICLKWQTIINTVRHIKQIQYKTDKYV